MTSLPAVGGLRWSESGQATISGPLLDLARSLDRRFVALGRRWQPEELRFPPLIPITELERIDYFRSFPHLATFAVCLENGEVNLEAHSRFTPVRDVLTPAACYHLYIHHAGERFARPRYFTTTNTCFRRETHYLPLERQWSFTMREIVCLGTSDEAQAFLAAARAELDSFAASIALPVTWDEATDPFFRPLQNRQYLMQRVDPTKHELLFDSRLAIASANLHHDHFGQAFDIQRASEPAHSACLAFGLERWLAAFVHHFGPEPAGWPEVGE